MRYIIGVGLALWLIGCSSPDFEQMALNRLEYAQHSKDDIEIAVFEDHDDHYLQGIFLAVEEINQRSDKLIGRTLKVHIEHDSTSFEGSKAAIRRVADNPKIIAVLGHTKAAIAIPASVAYDRSQLIFIPPFTSAQGLTSHNFQYVFRMMPNAKIMAEQLVSVASLMGYKNMVILYERDDINRELAFLFEDAAIQKNITLVQNSSFFGRDENYRNLISQFNTKPIDAVFIAASAAITGKMVTQLREMGINKPILGSEDLNLPAYVEAAGSNAENTIIPSVYNRFNEKNPQNVTFVQHYKARYGLDPDSDAAQGYDSVMLAATAIQKAGGTTPTLLASTLHYLPAWQGVTGLHAYSREGDLYGKKYLFNVWQKGQWHSLPAIHIPYVLERFEKSEGQHVSNSTLSLREKFSKPLSDEGRKMALLELAHATLGFNKLGIIYENTDSGKLSSDYKVIQSVSERRGFKVFECKIPFSTLAIKEIERELIDCFGKLSLSTDVQYIAGFDGINQNLINKLNRILPLFRSTSIALEQKPGNVNLSLLLDKRSDVDALGLGDMQVYRNLLNGIKLHELADSLHNLPEITINLQELQKVGIPDQKLLQLSPDAFIAADKQQANGQRYAQH